MTTILTARKSLEPWIKDEIAYYPHQIEAVRLLCKQRSYLLADDMGLGKSLVATTVFGVDVVRGWAETMLIVCPVSLKGNWADELEKFTRFPFVVLNGSPKERAKQLLEYKQILGPKVLITNYEQLIPHLAELNEMKFNVALFDEAHMLKNPKAARTKAALSLFSNRSFMLTGTPMLNHVNELWTILHRIDPTAYPRYYPFLKRYAVFGGFKDKQIVGVKNEKELTERLQAVMLRRMKSEVLDLPDVQIIERRVDMLPEQRKIYDQVLKEMQLPNPNSATPDDIENALTRFLRLKQICGTTKPFTGDDYSGKLNLVESDDMEILENGHRIVQFTQFRSMVECYTDRMKAYGMPIFELHGDVPASERSTIVKQWGLTSEPGVLVCMLQVAGVGLNMTQSRHGSFMDELFVPGLNQQAIDRLNRIGASTTQPIQIRKYITRNSIENRIQQILRTKTKLITEIVETDPGWKELLYREMLEAGLT